jgi:hypothetical protein
VSLKIHIGSMALMAISGTTYLRLLNGNFKKIFRLVDGSLDIQFLLVLVTEILGLCGEVMVRPNGN